MDVAGIHETHMIYAVRDILFCSKCVPALS